MMKAQHADRYTLDIMPETHAVIGIVYGMLVGLAIWVAGFVLWRVL